MKNTLSHVASRVADILLVDNPVGTAMGALSGIVAVFLTRLFRPVLEQIDVVDFNVNPLFYVCAGIFIANLPRWISGDRLPEPLETRLRLIRREVRARRLSKADAEALYRRLVEETIDAEIKSSNSRIAKLPESG